MYHFFWTRCTFGCVDPGVLQRWASIWESRLKNIWRFDLKYKDSCQNSAIWFKIFEIRFEKKRFKSRQISCLLTDTKRSARIVRTVVCFKCSLMPKQHRLVLTVTAYTRWQWRNFDPYLCQLVMVAVLWVNLWKKFATVISPKYVMLASYWS